MKTILLLVSCCFLHLTVFSQFTLRGSVNNTKGGRYLYLYKITGLRKDAGFIDRIKISAVQKFCYVLKEFHPGDLYKLTSSLETDMEEFPERAFVFAAEHKKELEFSAESMDELYKARVMAGSVSARLISSEILMPLSFYFEIAEGITCDSSENCGEYLFNKIFEFQREYIRSLQHTIVYSKETGLVITGLFFLAKMQQACGEGNFKSYYNTVRPFLPATDLTKDFRQLFEQPKAGIGRNDLLLLSMKSSDEKTAIGFPNILTTKYTLITFWASWCGPCRKAIQRKMRALVNRYKRDTTFSFVSVSVDADASQWQKFKKNAIFSRGNYLVNRAGSEILPDFLKGNGLPYYVLTDRNGYVLFSSNRPGTMKKRMKFYY